METPAPEVAPGDEQLSRLLEELEGQEIASENLGEVFYVLFLTSFQDGRVPVRMEYVFAAPDRTEQKITVGDFEAVGITQADKGWIKLAVRGWRYGWREADVVDHMGPMPELSTLCDGFHSVVSGFSPSNRDAGSRGAIGEARFPDVSGVEGQEGVVGIIAAVHYHAEETDRARIVELLGGDENDSLGTVYALGQEAAFDWWLAKDGNWPVRMEVVLTGSDEQGRTASVVLSTQVENLNDPDIKIEPPIENE